MGLVPGALSVAGSSKSGGVITSATASSLAAADLYRDANTLTYGDNKPTDDAIDRVVSKINMEYASFTPSSVLSTHVSVRSTASTRRASSPEDGPTRTTGISPTSTSTTRSSTRRCASLSPLVSRISSSLLTLDSPQIARYYDKYTKDIRDSFERGTAL